MRRESLHAGLRRAPVQMTDADLEQRLCIACGRPIPDTVQYTSATCDRRCSRHVSNARRRGRPIEWNREEWGRASGGPRRPQTLEERLAKSAGIRAYYQRKRGQAE
jgi:hypothetical protein